MRKIEAAILEPQEECLLALNRWLQRLSRRPLLAEIVGQCIELHLEHLRQTAEGTRIQAVEKHLYWGLIWESVPFSDLALMYGDWWKEILEDWLIDGWDTLLGSPGNAEETIDHFIELANKTRHEKGIYTIADLADDDRWLVEDFLTRWQNAALQALLEQLEVR